MNLLFLITEYLLRNVIDFSSEGNGNQQTMTSQLSCGMLVRALLPQLEKDRAMLIQTFYSQLQVFSKYVLVKNNSLQE